MIKYAILCALTAMTMACSSTSKPTTVVKNTITVSGQILHTRDYCGGAAPSEELLQQYKTPAPLEGLTLSLKRGLTNNIAQPVAFKVTTDSEGKYSLDIPTGDYVVLLPAQVNENILKKQPNIQITDSEKLDEWWKKGYAMIKRQDTHISETLHQKCDLPLGVPYVKYQGMPRP